MNEGLKFEGRSYERHKFEVLILNENNDNIKDQLKDYCKSFLLVCTNLTELKYETEKHKKTVDQLYSMLDKAVREDSKKKLTEAAIKASISINESYIELNNMLMDTKQEHDKWANLKQVFESRLQILLHLSGLENNKNKLKKF